MVGLKVRTGCEAENATEGRRHLNERIAETAFASSVKGEESYTCPAKLHAAARHAEG
jgi:hypothetical protein